MLIIIYIYIILEIRIPASFNRIGLTFRLFQRNWFYTYFYIILFSSYCVYHNIARLDLICKLNNIILRLFVHVSNNIFFLLKLLCEISAFVSTFLWILNFYWNFSFFFFDYYIASFVCSYSTASLKCTKYVWAKYIPHKLSINIINSIRL